MAPMRRRPVRRFRIIRTVWRKFTTDVPQGSWWAGWWHLVKWYTVIGLVFGIPMALIMLLIEKLR